ncbi:MAG: hypothetical protein RXR20_26745, partial [Paraburkholderia sp.]
MAQKYGTSRWQEIDQQRITLDPRTISERFSAWLRQPGHYAKFQVGMGIAACVLAFMWLPITLLILLAHFWFS